MMPLPSSLLCQNNHNPETFVSDMKDRFMVYGGLCVFLVIKSVCKPDSWREIYTPVKQLKPLASIVYVIFGVVIMITISSAFITSVVQFSNAAHIPFLFTSFVMAPIALNAKMVIDALLNAKPHVRTNASLKFSQIYDGLVMNNLLGLFTLLATLYIKGLSWTYSAEVLAIMIPCAIVGIFAFKRDNYPLWASIPAILLYPVSVYIYYVLANAS